ncbi:MAG: hypothetical protein CSYNP_04224 [Syntrophus sp. SKADARSKE-3]|nr:hypothetical protein [Syntrophus sp. SKADARSKE-3]
MKLLRLNFEQKESTDQDKLFSRDILPPPLFQQSIPEEILDSAKRVNIDYIINKLNYCHFNSENVFVSLKHPRHKENILLKAYPEPCSDANIVCCWHQNIPVDPTIYFFDWLIIRDGYSILLVPSEVKEINKETVCLRITDKAYIFEQRKIKRNFGKKIVAELHQKGIVISGNLVDFSSAGIRIRVTADKSSSLNWLNSDEKISLDMYNNNLLILSCNGRIVRQSSYFHTEEIVLEPEFDEVNRFHPKPFRPGRIQMVPNPKISFKHPLAGTTFRRTVFDLSCTGLSVDEPADGQVLLPGLIIPELVVHFSGVIKITCKAQVIYQKEIDEKTIRCGLAFLDMDVLTYNRLTQLICNAKDENTYISNEVDMTALWEFFFETGFIYPKKYKLVQSYVDRFKEVYRKLYQESPEIALHYTYEKNGTVFAHVSMLRGYEKAWMIHHHAARPISGRRTGFQVLTQMINYVNGIYHLPTPQMEYVFCYFRPDNGFPDTVYGDFARDYKSWRGCSLDLFAYMPYKISSTPSLPENWTLRESSIQDLWELDLFYRASSASSSPDSKPGMMMDAFELLNDTEGGGLKRLYHRLGFVRNWRTFSLMNKDCLKAVFLVNQADFGINLSELLNSVSIMVTDPQDLTWEILAGAVNKFKGVFKVEAIPLMIYPYEFAEANEIPFERKYFLWVFNLRRAAMDYMKYLQNRFRLNFG